MRMAAQYELLKELLNSGTKLSFEQEFFFKFYQAFILKDRWTQYINGVGTTLLVTAIALALGIVLGSVVALVRVAHDQQRPGRRNPVLGFFNIICEIYTTIIRGTPMMVQLLIMSMVIFANSRNFTMVGALALGINSGAYVSEIIRGGLMAVDPPGSNWNTMSSHTHERRMEIYTYFELPEGQVVFHMCGEPTHG